tara:strand:+ start:2938 stop:3336 length:399 start_codon:yes stop_codon:yes gene_type:complete
MEHDDIFDGLGIEIELKNPEDFLKIRETLTRIGVSSRKEQKLYQSCHILHKRGKYAIMHFKEFFILDGLESDISDTDIGRRNKICKLLEEWGLVVILDDDIEPMVSMAQIKIIPHKDKSEWELIPKYHIGRR